MVVGDGGVVVVVEGGVVVVVVVVVVVGVFEERRAVTSSAFPPISAGPGAAEERILERTSDGVEPGKAAIARAAEAATIGEEKLVPDAAPCPEEFTERGTIETRLTPGAAMSTAGPH